MKPHKTPPRKAAAAAREGRAGAAAAQSRKARETSAWPWGAVIAGGLLAVMTLAAYGPVFAAQFVWDDDMYVTHNATLRTLHGLQRIWFEPRSIPQYYPLVHTTFWIEYHLWALRPLGYHIVNVLLHATSAILFWRLLVRLHVPGAWLAGAIFALHPVEVESVAWITERKNVLAGALALSSLLAYFRFSAPDDAIGSLDATPPTGDPAGNAWYARPFTQLWAAWAKAWPWYLASLALFLGALLSKTVVCSLPAVVLVIFWWKRGRVRASDVLALAPFFALGLVLGLYTAHVERHYVGAEGPGWDFSVADRCLIAGRAVWFYAAKLVWPANLTFWYPRWTIDDGAWWQYLFPLGVLAVLAALWLARGRVGRAPLAAALIFVGALFPALGFFNVYPMRFSFVADHFQYHAGLALIALAAAGCALAVRRLRADERWIGRWVAAVLLLALGILTFRQTRVFYDPETLYTDTLAKNPNSIHAHLNLATYLSSQRRYDDAKAHYERALAIDPKDPTAHRNFAALLLHLVDERGNADGKLEKAIGHLNEALQLGADPTKVYTGLGMAMVQSGKPREAENYFASALHLREDNPEALYGMATVLGPQGKLAQAESYARRALEIKPDYPEAHHGMALIMIEQRRFPEATEHLNEALRLDPTLVEAQYQLGRVLALQQQYRQAIPHFSDALRMRPAYPQALNDLGVCLLHLGKADQAIPYFQAVLRIQPEDPDANDNLRKALELKRRGPRG
jgi:protein O-mannosyl-transferase